MYFIVFLDPFELSCRFSDLERTY